MSLVELTCEFCKKKFKRRRAEAARNQKLKRRIFCSLKCSGSVAAKLKNRNTSGLLKGYLKTDEFSQFRWHLRNIRRRGHKCQLTLADLKEKWDSQSGTCPYTGWLLKNMPTTSYGQQLPLTPDRASLDRIESSKGYVKGNIQFVSVIAQYAKHKWDEEEIFRFCEAVVKNKSI